MYSPVSTFLPFFGCQAQSLKKLSTKVFYFLSFLFPSFEFDEPVLGPWNYQKRSGVYGIEHERAATMGMVKASVGVVDRRVLQKASFHGSFS